MLVTLASDSWVIYFRWKDEDNFFKKHGTFKVASIPTLLLLTAVGLSFSLHGLPFIILR